MVLSEPRHVPTTTHPVNGVTNTPAGGHLRVPSFGVVLDGELDDRGQRSLSTWLGHAVELMLGDGVGPEPLRKFLGIAGVHRGL